MEDEELTLIAEIREYVMTVEPSQKSSTEIRDDLYEMLKEYELVP